MTTISETTSQDVQAAVPALDNLIVLYTGFTQPESREPGCELWDLYDKIRAAYPGANNIVQIRTWNSDVSVIAQEIVRLSPKRIVLIGHSYGLGRAVMALLKMLSSMGVSVTLVIGIDAVPNFGYWRWLSNVIAAFVQSDAPITLPANVDAYAYFRSVTEPLDNPHGRPLIGAPRSSGQSAPCVLAAAIGNPFDLAKHARFGELQIQDVVNHSQMDGDERIHSSVMKLLAQFIPAQEITAGGEA
jgi:pimeloyl-ACP methyl ester carboxylesterase